MKVNITAAPPMREFHCRRCGTTFQSDEYYITKKGHSDTCPGCGYSVWQYRSWRSIVRSTK